MEVGLDAAGADRGAVKSNFIVPVGVKVSGEDVVPSNAESCCCSKSSLALVILEERSRLTSATVLLFTTFFTIRLGLVSVLESFLVSVVGGLSRSTLSDF